MKQVVAVLVWCAVSAGCVAEDVKQPTTSETSKVTLTTHVDPDTGREYQEIYAELKISKINGRRSSEHNAVIGINDIAVEVFNGQSPISKPLEWGLVKYQPSINITYEDSDWNQFKGGDMSVRCRVLDDHEWMNVHCKKKGPPTRKCSISGDQEFNFKYFCSLRGSNEYFLNISADAKGE